MKFPTPLTVGSNTPFDVFVIPVPDHEPPTGVAVKLIADELEQRGDIAAMETESLGKTETTAVSVPPQEPLSE